MPFQRTRRHSAHTRRGFALLMVVACILLVTIAAVGVSRRSLLLAIESADAADQLQERWSRVSLQRSALQAAAAMYGGEPPVLGPPSDDSDQDRNPDESNRPPQPNRPPQWNPVYRWQLAVHDRVYTVVIADESAKANLNTVLQLKTPEAAHTLATSLAGRTMSRLSLPPRTGNRQEAIDPIGSWGQVLPVGANDGLLIRELPEATARLTIWGDGKVNLLRAPDDILFGLSRLIVSDGESRDWIREFREAFPEKSPDLVFRELGFEDQERMALLNLIALRSTTLSVWVLEAPPSSCHTLTLASRAGSGVWETRTVRYTR